MNSLRFLLLASLFTFSTLTISDPLKGLKNSRSYVCPPCVHVDKIFESEEFKHDGQCHVCGMNLIEKNLLEGNKIDIHDGSGNFLINGGINNESKEITVFYHKPKSFNLDTKILIVLPGAGRNAWDYRDSWIKASEHYNILILSPFYSAYEYDYSSYHLGGMVSSITFNNLPKSTNGKSITKFKLRDEDIVLGENTASKSWIYNDLDRVFDIAIEVTGLKQTGYDIFGHSAGAQILHRMVMFYPQSKAINIIAANSGTYTIPSQEFNFPYGLRTTNFSKTRISHGFKSHLILMLGELDNENEIRGKMLHTPTADQQGISRIDRGKCFYSKAKKLAQQAGVVFNWEIEVVEGVGHEYKKMGRAAAEKLYGRP